MSGRILSLIFYLTKMFVFCKVNPCLFKDSFATIWVSLAKEVMVMKKIKWFIKTSIIFILLIGILIGIKIAPIIVDGYHLYKGALEEKSVKEAILEIQEDKHYISMKEIPKEYIEEVIQTEDKRFYYHYGIDAIAVFRAMYHNVKEKSFVQGGSTITQQLAKNMFFSFDKNLERKVAEAFMAVQLEHQLTKNEILELYCNITYLGEGCYGIQEAAKHYYDTTPKELTKSQITTLVFSFRNPAKYNPKAQQ